MKTFPRYRVETGKEIGTGRVWFYAMERVRRGYNYRYASCGKFATREEAQAKVEQMRAS